MGFIKHLNAFSVIFMSILLLLSDKCVLLHFFKTFFSVRLNMQQNVTPFLCLNVGSQPLDGVNV